MQALYMQRKLTNSQFSLAHDIKVRSQQIHETKMENAKQKEFKKQSDIGRVRSRNYGSVIFGNYGS